VALPKLRGCSNRGSRRPRYDLDPYRARHIDVLIPDGCAFKVARALSGLHPGTGTAAELKLHAVYSPELPHALEAFLEHLARSNDKARPKQIEEFSKQLRPVPG
jgi:hypothetical protein